MKCTMISREDGSKKDVCICYARERLEPNWYLIGTVDEIVKNDENCQLRSCSFIYDFQAEVIE